MRRALPLLALLALAGCGDKAAAPAAVATVPPLTGVQARPPAPATAGALSRIPTTAAGERRFGYVNLARIDDVAGALPPAEIREAVLGKGAARVEDVPGARTAVQVADVTVFTTKEDAAEATLVGDDALVDVLADRRPQRNLIQDEARSAVQTCLGDSTAETVLGPKALGFDVALGAGLREASGRVDVVLCYAPRLIREIDAGFRRIVKRYDLDLEQADTEIGEREMLAVTIPAPALERRQIRALLEGGAALRSIAR